MMMKIGELAQLSGVSADTLRYYEKLRLLDPPTRSDNGYRSYGNSHLERVQFIRSARGLGFSLSQIADIVPRLSSGQFGRKEIEQQLKAKIAEIDAQMQTLQNLRQSLLNTFDALSCPPGDTVSTTGATVQEPSAPVRIKGLHAREK